MKILSGIINFKWFKEAIIIVAYCYLILTAVLSCLYTAAAVLTPREIHICPLDTVRFSCVINREQNTNLILWRIDFMHQSVTPIQETFIADTDRPGLNRTQTNNVQQSVAFMLISTFPYLNSTMHMTATIKDSSQFSQILITCNNVSEPASTLDMSTIYVIPQGSYCNQTYSQL